MDDDVQAQLGSEVELLLEDDGLLVFDGGGVDGGFEVGGGFVADDIEGGAALGGAGEAVVIEPGLAEPDDARTLREGAEVVDEAGRGFTGGVRVDADDGEDLRILLGEGDRAAAAFDRGADAEDAGDAGGGGALEKGGEVVGELGEVEMGVGVGEHARLLPLDDRTRPPQPVAQDDGGGAG